MALSNFGASTFRYICETCLLIRLCWVLWREGFSLVASSGGCPPAASFSAEAQPVGHEPREFRLQPLKHRPAVVAHPSLVTPRTADLPGSGLNLHLPALAGGFFNTEPPGKLLKTLCTNATSPLFRPPLILAFPGHHQCY